MKRLSGRQTRLVNRQASRTGTLWEGRYRSSPIETVKYLLACCRYVELNPVRAGLVDDPASYPWSSYRRHAGRAGEYDWLDIDPCYEGLGNSDSERALRYREFVRGAIPAGEWGLIREALQRGQAITGRRIENRKPGRPRRDDDK